MDSEEKLRKNVDEEQRYTRSLRSGNKGVIIETISEIRKRGSITILPELFELMLINEDREVLEACTKLLNDLKDKEAIPVIIDAIKDDNFLPIRKELVASCWQNGLGYHKHLPTFIDVAIESDFATTLEAFTVIEESLGETEDSEKRAFVDKLKKNLTRISEDKQMLISEMISTIDKF